ncbi:MAG: nucleotidyltransferase family protein [Bacteroidales bacterium]|nr:nucleotidyltransferase family protein [Bacteroidales bacterium]
MNREITEKIRDYFKDQPVLKAWLFGSYARGEQTPESDIDIMVSLDPKEDVSLLKLANMYGSLNDLLGVKVDLVTDKGLMDFARQSVNKDKIFAL